MAPKLHLLWPLLVVVPLGCSPKGPATVPVSGTVTLDKKPLAHATVTFSPIDDKDPNRADLESSGQTDEQGHYTLKMTKDSRPGATAGQHRVRVSVIDRKAANVPGKAQRLPAEYNSQSRLAFTVPEGGTQEANFDLSNQPQQAQPRHRPTR